MDTSSFGSFSLFSWPVVLLLLSGVAGQEGDRRGDVPLDQVGSTPGEEGVNCSCGGSVVAGVIVTAVVLLVLAGFWWCFQERRHRKRESKPDPEAVNRAAYDNPHFQGDDLDQSNDGQTRINIGPTPPIPTSVQYSTTTTTIATSTTSTLERGKSTLEKVMAAVIRGSRSGSPKRTKDDTCLEPMDVVVPLQGHDFIGLGFTVHGNLKEGLYVKEVMSRGPANESGKVVPGDRIVALTVLTDHMAFKDALTILSYASPYPVLLHLQKKQSSGAFSASSPLSSKVKLNQTSSSSEKLVHPSFRSQSHGDLAKIEDIDIKRLKMGNLIPPSKGKPGLAVELSRTQINRQVQRKTENRHSERAIDVPGVDIKTKSVVVDIDSMNEDKVELANVQVHQPMTSKIGLDIPDASVELHTFQDANLSGTAENIKVELDEAKSFKQNSKTKFGVKVFPDMIFKKGADLEYGLRDTTIDSKVSTLTVKGENKIEMQNNEENSQIELSLDTSTAQMKGLDFQPTAHSAEGKGSIVAQNTEGKTKHGFKLDMPDIYLPSLNFSSEGKKTMEIESDVGDAKNLNKKGNVSAHFGSPDITLPSLSIKEDKKYGRNEEEYLDDDSKMNKSKGFKFDLPDINMPSFGFQGSTQSANKHADKENDREIHLEGPDISIPTVAMEVKSKPDDLDKEPKAEDDKSKSKHGFKFEMPDISMPSFKFRGHGNRGKDSENEDDDHDRERENENLKLKLEGPDINISSVKMQTQIKANEKEEQDSGDEKSKKKTKHGFRFGVPDIHMPSFGRRSHDKSDRDSDNEDDEMKKKKKHELKLGTPNVDLPAVDMEAGVKTSIHHDHESDGETDKASKYGFTIGMPDCSLSSLNHKRSARGDEALDSHTKIDVKDEIKTDKDNAEYSVHGKNKEKSKHEFKIGMPDLHMPSFNLRGHNNKDKDHDKENDDDTRSKEGYELKLEKPDLYIPSVKMEAELKSKKPHDSESGDENEMKKSKYGFRFGMPDISVPSFSLKGHAGNDKHSESEDNDHDRKERKEGKLNLEGPNVNLPSVSLETQVKHGDKHDHDSEDEKDKIRSGHGFKLGMSSFGFKSHGKDDRESDEDNSDDNKKGGKEIELQLEGPSIDIPSVSLKTDMKSDERKDHDSEDENDKKKSNHEFRFGMPDISMPSFGLRSHGKGDRDPEDKDKDHKSKKSQEFVELQLGGPDMSISSAKLESEIKSGDKHDYGSGDENDKKKSKYGLKFGMPSFGLKSHGKGEKDSDDDDNDSERKRRQEDIKLKMECPVVNIPPVSLETELKSEERKDYDSEDEKDKKSKHGFRFGMPDISMPSFGLRGDGKGEKNSEDEDNGHDMKRSQEVELKLEGPHVNVPSVSMETCMKSEEKADYDSEDDKGKKKTKHGFKIGMPSFVLRGHSKSERDSDEEEDDHRRRRRQKENELNLEGPDVNLPSVSLETQVKHGDKHDHDSEDEKDKKRSRHGFKLGMPSFGLKSHEKFDIESGEDNSDGNKKGGKEIELQREGPSVDVPSVSLKTDMKFDERKDCDSGDEKDRKKSKHGFRFGMPDISMPSFGLRGHGKGNKDSENEDNDPDRKRSQEVELKLESPNVNIQRVSLETEVKVSGKQDHESENEKEKKKTKHAFKVGMPSFGLKSHGKRDKDSDGEDNDYGKGEVELKLDAPDINIPSATIQKETKSDHKFDHESVDENYKKKSKHGFKIGMPDINVPSFNLKSHKNERDSEDEGDKKLDMKHNINVEGPDINIPLGKMEVETKAIEKDEFNKMDEKDKKKSKHGFKIGMPSFGLRSHSKNDRNSDEEDNDQGAKRDKELVLKLKDPDISIPTVGAHTEVDAEGRHEDRDEHSLKLEGPSIDLNVPGVKVSQESNDHDRDEKDKKKSKHGFQIRMQDFNMPSYIFEENGRKDNKHADDEDGASKRNYDLKLEGPTVYVPIVDMNIKTDKENKPEETTNEKSKYGLNIEMSDTHLPSFTSKKKLKTDQIVENIDKESKDKLDVHLEGPDINMTSVGLEEEIKPDEDFKNKSTDDKSKKSKYDFNLDMPSIKFSSFSSKKNDKDNRGLDDEENTSKLTYDLTLKEPNICLPGSMRTHITSGEGDDPLEKGSKKKPEYGLKIVMPNTNVPFPEVRQNIRAELDQENKREYDLKVDQANLDTPWVDIKIDRQFEVEGRTGIKESEHGIKMAVPDVGISSDSREISNFSVKPMHFKVNVDDSTSTMVDYIENREKLKHTLSSDSYSVKKSKEEKEKKKIEKTGFNFKFKGPEFYFPHFGNKSEKSSKELKLEPDPQKAIDVKWEDTNVKISHACNYESKSSPLPYSLKFDRKFSKASSLSSEVDYDMECKTSGMSISSSDFGSKVNKATDWSTGYKLKADKIDSLDNNESKGKDSESFSWKVKHKDPSVSIPKYDMVEKRISVNQEIFNDEESPAFEIPNLKNVMESAGSHFEIPKVGISTNRTTVTQTFKEASSQDDDKVTLKSEATINVMLPTFRGEVGSENYKVLNAAYSLPDEVKVVNSRTGAVLSDGKDLGKTGNCELHANLLSTDLPNIKIRRLSDDNFSNERVTYERKISINANVTDLDTESLEDERDDGLNATDATKKKRSGFKIITSETPIPIFKKVSKEGVIRQGVDSDKNQSDEMKSFNLKLKTPSVNAERTSAERADPKELHKEMYVHLPRVKISNMKSKDAEERENWSEKINIQYSEDRRSSAPALSLPRLSFEQTMKENESDERKMKEVDASLQTNVSLLREKFNIKMKENDAVSSEVKAKTDIDAKHPTGQQFRGQSNSTTEKSINTGKLSFNIDDPDFLIPDLKSQPGYDSPLLTETFSIPSFKLRDTTGNASKAVDTEVKWKIYSDKEDLSEYRNHKLSESDLHSKSGTHEKLKTSDFNVFASSNVNVSFDSSSVETESDLPEADSDFKKASRHYSLDVPIPKLSMIKMNLEKSFNKDSDLSNSKTDPPTDKIGETGVSNFGSVFGFRGFKKHIDVGGAEKMEANDGNIEDYRLNIKGQSKDFSHESFPIGKVDLKLSAEPDAKLFSATKDLPEVDYDLDFKNKSYPESDINISSLSRNLHLPEGDQNINYSIETPFNATEKSYKLKQDKGHEFSNPELEVKVQKKLEMDSEASKPAFPHVKEAQDKPNKGDSMKRGKKDDDDDKSKSKMKIGLGFGFKGFNKASDSDDNESVNKIFKEPERDMTDLKERAKSKPKKTFSFKGFGKSTSDTDEENAEKISEHPMEKIGAEDKVKINKTNINFGFKPKNAKNSDSDDNGDNEKVELKPQVELNQKKSKIKSNLGFGFMNKSKVSESESIGYSDTANENKKEQQTADDNKGKAKNTINIGIKGSRDNKYDARSESEGGEEEKLSTDSRGEDNRSKSRYGIGFGFKKSHGKISSDSECGEYDEQKVHFDERGSGEKAKEPKSKSLKLGFKGFKNLKGKIQTEINKIRHDSPSSDEESISRDEENQGFGEKRKKPPKKKDKDKKIKREVEKSLDATEEATVTSVALAAKENRRKKFDSKTSSSSSSSSSSDSSSDDEEKPVEQKKKKKSKLKRKEEGKIVTTSVMDVVIPQEPQRVVEIDEHISASHRSFETADITQGLSESHVTIVRSEPSYSAEQTSFKDIQKQGMEIQTDPHKYLVVREMKLKENATHIDSDEVTEVIEKIDVHNDIPRPLFLKERAMLVHEMEADGTFWGSDSDMEKRENANSEVNLSKTSVALTASGKQRILTDSEELKRKATSLGDLSRLHEGGSTGTPLERAVSLDLKNASVGHPNLHVRRLQLPDSSATSIDEVDEHLMSPSPKKLEVTGGLKAASQWGTLEEAMNLGMSSSKHMKSDTTISTPSIMGKTTILKTTSTTDEGAPISNIEISGERGSSITAVSGHKDKWNDSFDDDDELPSLPSSPVPIEKTTITVVEKESSKKNSNKYSGSDSSIVVVGTETIQHVNNFHNLNFQLNPTTISSPDAHLLSSHGVLSSSNASINSDSGRYSPRPGGIGDKDDPGGVTVTMVPAESHLSTQKVDSVGQSIAGTASPQPPQNRALSSLPELVTYDNLHESSHVTISHDWMRENGDVMETSEHNVSDEFITPDSSPQKSMTQITLDGDGVSGYTVTEGTISRTVIISNPDSASPVSIVQTDSSDLSLSQMK